MSANIKSPQMIVSTVTLIPANGPDAKGAHHADPKCGSIAADKGACSRGFAKRGSCARNEYASHKP